MHFTVLQAIFSPYCITEEGLYMGAKQLFSFKSSNSVFKTDYDPSFYAVLANILLFLSVRSKFFLIILFVTGAQDNLPGITNVYGLDVQGIEFSVLSTRTPRFNRPPVQTLSILCRRQSGRSLVLTILPLVVPLSNGFDL